MSNKTYLISLKKHTDKYLSYQNFNKYFRQNKLWEKGNINRNIDFSYNEGNAELWNKHMIISNNLIH